MQKLLWLPLAFALLFPPSRAAGDLPGSAFGARRTPPRSQGIPGDSEDGAIEELERARLRQRKAYEEINRANPFAHPGGGSGGLSAVPPAPRSGLGKLISHPWLQKYLRFLAREDVQGLIEKMAEHPRRLWLLVGEGGWFVFFLGLRAWRLSKVPVTQWAKALWISFWSFAVYVAGMVFGVPWLVFGDLWARFLKLLF